MPVEIDILPVTGTQIQFRVRNLVKDSTYYYTVNDPDGRRLEAGRVKIDKSDKTEGKVTIRSTEVDRPAGAYQLRVYADSEWSGSDNDNDPGGPMPGARPDVRIFQFIPVPEPTTPARQPQVVQLAPAASTPTVDEVLSVLVRSATEARSFANYKAYVDPIVCRSRSRRGFGPDAYRRLRRATAEFLDQVRGPVVDPGEVVSAYLTADHLLPYVGALAQHSSTARDGDPCSDLDPDVLSAAFPVELIWSYWEEWGGLVQTFHHLLARFQNRRVTLGRDPLARLSFSPLKPVAEILYEFAENQISQLSVRRRDLEYRCQYGLHLLGRAVPDPGHYVESNTRFVEAWHTLLHEAHEFHRRDDDMTVNADAFPVHTALRDTHLVLAEGAVNSFTDLTFQARQEMLMMQWTLSLREVGEFLGGKPMIPYDEPWQERVDAMKTLAGWSLPSSTHFHELAVCGERLLLTVRWGAWNSIAVTTDSARNWARTWRNDIQRYIHAYRVTTGVDLTVAPDARPPGYLFARRGAALRGIRDGAAPEHLALDPARSASHRSRRPL